MNTIFADIAQLHFLRPWWLLALLVLPALLWWWRAGAQRRSPWQDAVDAHLLPHLLDTATISTRRSWTRWLGLLAAVLLVLAMAGPSWRKDEHPLWQSKAPLVVALDLSSSILTGDLPPSRLPQARAKIATLLRERAGGQIALVAFADDAYTVAPLTEDAANVALFLDALSPDVMPEDGQRVDRAIAWSRRLLQQAGHAQGDILLLTDHADAADVSAAASAHASGYRVSALGLGTAQGGSFDTGAGSGQARLDAASLRRLAAGGGGSYQTLTTDDADLRALGVLDPRSDSAAATRGEKIARWRDDGVWLLPLALLLLLPMFRRGAGMVAMLVLVMLVPVPPAQAQAPIQTGKAQDAPRDASQDTSGLWKRPDQAAYARMQEGITAYRKQEFDTAIKDFSGNPTADGQYNLGNALAKAGQLDAAIAAYDRAIKLRPRMDDAIANRAIVDAARKRKPPPGDKSQQNQQQKQKPGQDQKGDPQQGQPGQDQQDAKSSDNPSQSRKPEPPPAQSSKQPASQQDAPRPQDAKAQADADAAQRQRMQDALTKQGAADKSAEQATQAKPETAGQRERRLANQAQLQRVPDDPGALLRARFRLEYERRRQVGGGP